MSFLPLRALSLGFILCLPLPASSSREKIEPGPWEKASQFLFNEAHHSFQSVAVPGREERLGTAVVLLNIQPRTSGNISAARKSLEKLVAEIPADEVGINARFFLGRIALLHSDPAEPSVARSHFEALVSAHPAHPLAQQSVVKLALIDFYPPGGAIPGGALYTAYERQAASLTDDSSRRDLCLLLARTCLFYHEKAAASGGFNPDEFALRQYQAALATDMLSFRSRGETLVAVGEIARKLGLKPVAAAAYRDFLASYSRDIRAGTIADRLNAIESPPTPAIQP